MRVGRGRPSAPRRKPRGRGRGDPAPASPTAGVLGLAGLLLIVLVALVGPRLLAYGPTEVNILEKLPPPLGGAPAGHRLPGADVLSRAVDAAHRSLGTAVVVVGCVLAVSVVLGALAGFAGGASTPP